MIVEPPLDFWNKHSDTEGYGIKIAIHYHAEDILSRLLRYLSTKLVIWKLKMDCIIYCSQNRLTSLLKLVMKIARTCLIKNQLSIVHHVRDCWGGRWDTKRAKEQLGILQDSLSYDVEQLSPNLEVSVIERCVIKDSSGPPNKRDNYCYRKRL